MIFKKPYAFIIKHLKLIHLLLLIPIVYLLARTNKILVFFNSYIRNSYTLYNDDLISKLSSEYINIFMYLATILVIITIVLIITILQKKERKTKIYTFSLIYYIILFLGITAVTNVFGLIEENALNNVVANIVRDIIMIIYYVQYFILAYFFIRGIGFNIHNFNFKSELDNLEIEKEDYEEFELSVNNDAYIAKRSLRRFLRELKYYYLENKFVIIIVTSLVIISLGTYLYLNIEVYNKNFDENDNIAFGYVNFKINNSYITDTDLNGKTIKDDKRYLILDLTLTNRSYQERAFNYRNLLLTINDQKLLPNLTLANYFKDFGYMYKGDVLGKGATKDYILIYEFPKNIKVKKYELETYNGSNIAPGGVGVRNIYIKLDPNIISNNVTINNYNMNNLINLNNTNLLNSKVEIKDYYFTNRFAYTVNNVQNDIYINSSADLNKTLMVMDYNLFLDENSKYLDTQKDYQAFFEDFMKIVYVVNSKEYESNVKLCNPSNYSEKLVFKIDNNILYADSIRARITIRNKAYNIILK